MKKQLGFNSTLLMTSLISVIIAYLILSIFRTVVASRYQNQYLNLSQKTYDVTEQIYSFNYLEALTYDSLSHALADIEIAGESITTELQKVNSQLPYVLSLVDQVSIIKAKKIQADIKEYASTINTLLGANVSNIYADQTIEKLKTQLLKEYSNNQEQISLFHTIYAQPSSNINEDNNLSKLHQDSRYHILLNYIDLKSRVEKIIHAETQALSKRHIQKNLNTVNNYWMTQVANTKVNVAVSSLILVLTLGLYLLWLQRNGHRIANTAQLELLNSEKQRSQLSLLLAHAQDAIVITDKHGVITWINNGFETLSGYNAKASIGQKIIQLMPAKQSDSSRLDRLQTALDNGTALQTELQISHDEGYEYWIELILTPVLDEEGLLESFIAVERDVTTYRKLQQSLAESAEQANSSNKAKSTFLATMSHELRTPLNGIMGMAQIIENASQDTAQKKQLNILLESSHHLLSLLNDILDFSKIEQNKLELESLPFRLSDITEPILSTYTALCQDKGIELIIDNQIPVHHIFNGDKSRIRQIIFNLLSNAVKFTFKGDILLTFSEETSEQQKRNEDSSTIGIIIRDSGVGIPQDSLTHIFDPFVQAESSTTRKFGGTGLGLAIVKQLVELMKGSIKVVSEVNIGTCFSIKLQLSRAEELPEQCQNKHDLNKQVLTHPLNILIVEDNRVNALVAKTFCQKQGHSVSVAENGAIAIEVVQKQHFDLVIMDNHMPEMDGVTATKYMRKTLNMDTIIFGCTADVFKDAHDNFITAGVNHVLTKPLQKESFIDALILFQHQLVPQTFHSDKQPVNVIELSLYRPRIQTNKQFTEAEIDFEFINEISGRDIQASLVLITSFKDTTEEKIESLITAYENADVEQIYHLAYSLQDIANTLNISRLTNKAREISSCAHQGKLPKLKPMQELLNLLDVNAHQALRILTEHKKELNEKP